MTHNEHLAQADRFIAECKNRVERQREIIASAYENGHPTVLPVALLRVLEENLRSFEKYRQLVICFRSPCSSCTFSSSICSLL
jgi:hypothetical protein